MRKFFSEYPILATCISTCFSLILISVTGTFLFVLFVAKVASNVSREFKDSSNEATLRSAQYKSIYGNKDSQNKFLLIPVKGVILTSEPTQDFFTFFLDNQSIGYKIKNELVKAAGDESIKGVVLDIDSPGGTITGSKAISDGIEYYKQTTKKPVLAYVSGIGASGAYWTAASADKIISDSGTLVGSIGAIMGPFKYYNKVISESNFSESVTTENGIDSYYIYAGEDKDLGNPYKKLSDKAKTTLQEGINNEYDSFVKYVSTRRNIDTEVIKKEIGAYVYGGEQALKLKLIDEIGSMEFAFDKIAETSNIDKNDFQIVTTNTKKGFWSELLNSSSVFKNIQSKSSAKSCILCNEMLFLYGKPEDYAIK